MNTQHKYKNIEIYMAHFAKLDSNNKVLRVSVVADRIILDANGEESEELGIKHLKKIHGEDTICCLLYTSPSPRDISGSRMPSSA